MSKFTRTTQAMIFLLITLFMGTSVVAADYIGPDRSYTVHEATICSYEYSASGQTCFDHGYLGSPCTCHINECDSCLTGTGGCISVPSNIVDSTCGDGFSEDDHWVNYHDVTYTHPYAEASTVWSCPIPGNNGWCQSPFQVQLNGVDLYASAGYYITALEGSLDGVPFFADGVDTITIEIGEGTHHLDFWALSSYGDSSYHFIENYYVDTVNPVINASLSGTPGDNNWFVSDTTLTVTFTDPTPASGVEYTRALSNGAEFSVISPVTFTEGVYALQLDVRDYAGLTAQTLYTLMVDTTPPAVTANQPAVEVAVDGVAGGGYVNGSVVFTGTTTDATSGVNSIELSTDGSMLTSITPNADGSWTLDWDSSMLSDGTYTPVITAVDNAGNRTDITMLPITLDNSAPAMSITGGWYIWDSGHIVTYDTRVGIARIELSVRDDQNRWPAREWDYDTQKLEMDLQWDREFGDGTVAPTGTYEVLLQAWDRLGNGRYITAHIYIPEAGATAVIPYDGMLTAGDVEPTSTPLPTEEISAAAVGGSEPQPTNTPQPTSTMIAVPLSGGEDNTVILSSADSSGDSAPANTTPISDGILWGAAAVAAGAAAAIVSQKQLEETRKKEQAILDAKAQERLIQHWSNVVASYGGTYDHEATLKQIAEKEKFWNDYWIASQKKYYEEQRIKANEAAAANAAATAKAAFEASNPEIAAMINSQEQLKDENDARRYAAEAARYQALAEAYYEKEAAKEYSNQVKAFQEGEEASIDSYEEYKAYHDKMDKVEQLTEDKNVIEQKPQLTTDQTIPMTGIAASMPSTNYYPMNAGYTQEELQAMVDENIEKIEEMEENSNDSVVKKWWEESLNWIDEHQKLTSLGVGAVIGVAAIAITLAAVSVVTLPIMAIAALGAAVVSGGVIAAGTVGLNNYYGRDPSMNIWGNIITGSLTAAAVTGIGLFIASGMVFGVINSALTTVGGYAAQVCTAHPNACANLSWVMKGLDFLEEATLEAQYQIQLSRGDPAAIWTALELEVERSDGGLVGNYVLMEGLRYLQKYLPDSFTYIQQYGNKIIPFLQKYGDEGMEFLDNYLDDGAEFVLRHIDDLDALSLAFEYGKPAMKLVDTVDAADAKRLLTSLDTAKIDDVLTLSEDAIKALAKWETGDLVSYGSELIARAEKDANIFNSLDALKQIKKDTGSIDFNSNEVKKLIDEIAENSIQDGSERFALGKWAGRDGGYIGLGRNNGYIFYESPAEFGTFVNNAFSGQSDEIFWSVNQRVIQKYINEGTIFEYTLDGIPNTKVEIEAINAIWGNTKVSDVELMALLGESKMPGRIKELQELRNAGYELLFDRQNNIFTFTLP